MDIELHDGDDLEPLGGFGILLHTPGHTAGSSSVLLAGGELLAGDALAGGLLRPSRAHGPMFATDLGVATQSISMIAARGREVWVGHGGRLDPRSVVALAR